eukprot:GHVR01006671.1.p1 GENE.GHVR01006671.1~~GHVR01006671.1.p1  ORF type:complete len:530 (+),score=107.88 GHVR01006671.1:69-1658(+)
MYTDTTEASLLTRHLSTNISTNYNNNTPQFHFKGGIRSFCPTFTRGGNEEEVRSIGRMKKKLWDSYGIPMHFFSLEFDHPQMENLYRGDMVRRSTGVISLSLLLVIFIVSLMVLWNYHFFKDLDCLVAILPPPVIAILALELFPGFKRYSMTLCTCTVLIMGICFVCAQHSPYIIIKDHRSNQGLVIVALALAALLKLRFTAFIATAALCFSLHILLVKTFLSSRVSSDFPLAGEQLAMNVSALIVGAVVTYSLEMLSRRDFLLTTIVLHEQKRASDLLDCLLPQHLLERVRLQPQGCLTPSADSFDEVTVLRADSCDLLTCPSLSTYELVGCLNVLFSSFDNVIKSTVFKVKTFKDAYVVASGLPNPCTGHCYNICDVALKILAASHRVKDPHGNPMITRVAVHTGPCIAGVIGVQKLSYDVWGEAVDVTESLLPHVAKGQVVCTRTTFLEIKSYFKCDVHESLPVGTYGVVQTYRVCEKSLQNTDSHVHDGQTHTHTLTHATRTSIDLTTYRDNRPDVCVCVCVNII